MWVQEWNNIFDIVQLYLEVKELDMNRVLKEKGYNVGNMFRRVEEFYIFLGLYKMVLDFW